MNPVDAFKKEVEESIRELGTDEELRELSRRWVDRAAARKYTYNFRWMGRPIIQLPQDIVAMQEIIWNVRPDLIIETGIAHGGSLVFSASMLELLGGDRIVVGVDIDIRQHNRSEIEAHPLFHRIRLVEGSSVDGQVAARIRSFAADRTSVLVVLDSNHTHDHVLRELELYADLVNVGSYLIVLDTVVEDMDPTRFKDRPWGKGNNPKTAVREFLKSNPGFQVDRTVQDKLSITVAPEGYLRRIA